MCSHGLKPASWSSSWSRAAETARTLDAIEGYPSVSVSRRANWTPIDLDSERLCPVSHVATGVSLPSCCQITDHRTGLPLRTLVALL